METYSSPTVLVWRLGSWVNLSLPTPAFTSSCAQGDLETTPLLIRLMLRDTCSLFDFLLVTTCSRAIIYKPLGDYLSTHSLLICTLAHICQLPFQIKQTQIQFVIMATVVVVGDLQAWGAVICAHPHLPLGNVFSWTCASCGCVSHCSLCAFDVSCACVPHPEKRGGKGKEQDMSVSFPAHKHWMTTWWKLHIFTCQIPVFWLSCNMTNPWKENLFIKVCCIAGHPKRQGFGRWKTFLSFIPRITCHMITLKRLHYLLPFFIFLFILRGLQ